MQRYILLEMQIFLESSIKLEVRTMIALKDPIGASSPEWAIVGALVVKARYLVQVYAYVYISRKRLGRRGGKMW
jgi:hypothetical protein